MSAPDPQRGASAAGSPDGPFLFPRPVRPFAIAAGLVLTALGIAGAILPLMPGTGFLVLAAWLFAGSSPRFERWLLDLPVVGQLVRDFRSGAGMTLRAKWVTCLTILLAVGLSVGRIPVLIGQVAWVLIGLFGVWYIARRVRTKPLSEV
ncbi:YbaN family protein [Deinococcus sp. Marseille-Q6407]|uniref:YbaN family protein n=1 Tax=Deinococcus sp. Marseille-Q6407 TaxID=2969223 RepID=UPI0021BF03DD|nr:YbaN family protein [Deinococcus sp. Marseille-Q6407]